MTESNRAEGRRRFVAVKVDKRRLKDEFGLRIATIRCQELMITEMVVPRMSHMGVFHDDYSVTTKQHAQLKSCKELPIFRKKLILRELKLKLKEFLCI
eukprot:scaffold100757_cov24-Prasinocladus_malaysianus.AAC.2